MGVELEQECIMYLGMTSALTRICWKLVAKNVLPECLELDA